MVQSLSLAVVPSKQVYYRPRRPEAGKIFSIIQKNWLKFVAQAELTERNIAGHVTREFEEFLGCGVLAKGFVRLKCEDCDEGRLVPFSCKRRGFCPSCCGRRMNEGAAFLVDNVIPRVPIRQWVLSVPMPVRFWMARNPRLTTAALSIFHRAMAAHYKRVVKKLGVNAEIQTGAVTVVQRFGSALNLNIHFHALLLDGVFVHNHSGAPEFIETLKPTQDEIHELIQTIQKRMLRLFQRRGLVGDYEDAPPPADVEEAGQSTLEALCQSASIQYKMALGEQADRRVRRIGSLGFVGEKAALSGELSASLGGYSLHANTYVQKNDRPELERLCRYILRPPVAEERIELKGASVVYKLKTRWSDGTSAIVLTSTEFIEKLVALIPQPRIHLIRFHGILAPHSKLRAAVVPSSKLDGKRRIKSRPPRLAWAALLKRVFKVDLQKCPKCGGEVRFVAAIVKADTIEAILRHLGLPTQAPKFVPP